MIQYVIRLRLTATADEPAFAFGYGGQARVRVWHFSRSATRLSKTPHAATAVQDAYGCFPSATGRDRHSGLAGSAQHAASLAPDLHARHTLATFERLRIILRVALLRARDGDSGVRQQRDQTCGFQWLQCDDDAHSRGRMVSVR